MNESSLKMAFNAGYQTAKAEVLLNLATIDFIAVNNGDGDPLGLDGEDIADFILRGELPESYVCDECLCDPCLDEDDE